MKQTAVEWLMIRLPRGLVEGFKDAFEEAKVIEKEQIENAHNSGFEEGHKHVKSNYTFFPQDGLQYYNETYNK